MVGNELADRPLQQTRPPRDDDYETGDTRPVPDPTRLTTLALEREIAHLKEAQKRDREAVKELFRTQFDAQEKALALVQSNADKQPSAAVLQETLLKLREVTDQKFDGFEKAVNQRFDAVNLRFSDNAKTNNATNRFSIFTPP